MSITSHNFFQTSRFSSQQLCDWAGRLESTIRRILPRCCVAFARGPLRIGEEQKGVGEKLSSFPDASWSFCRRRMRSMRLRFAQGRSSILVRGRPGAKPRQAKQRLTQSSRLRRVSLLLLLISLLHSYRLHLHTLEELPEPTLGQSSLHVWRSQHVTCLLQGVRNLACTILQHLCCRRWVRP